MKLHMLKQGLCYEFMTRFDSGRQMQQVWDDVIVPALASSGAGCIACQEQGTEYTGDKIGKMAENWLLYMETFLHVLTYLTAHEDQCTNYISTIQSSWNDLADGARLAYGGYNWVYEFWWSDFMNHPRLEQRPASLKGLYEGVSLHTTWNPFRSKSSLDRIIGVANSLGIYNEMGQVT